MKRGVLVLAGSLEEDEARERELVSAFASRRVDGLVIMPASHDHTYLLNERKAGTPLVFVDRPPAFLDADTVLTDNVGGVRRGIQHLCAGGHQRIAYLGDLQSIMTAALRYQGYRQELNAQVLHPGALGHGFTQGGQQNRRAGGDGRQTNRDEQVAGHVSVGLEGRSRSTWHGQRPSRPQ